MKVVACISRVVSVGLFGDFAEEVLVDVAGGPETDTVEQHEDASLVLVFHDGAVEASVGTVGDFDGVAFEEGGDVGLGEELVWGGPGTSTNVRKFCSVTFCLRTEGYLIMLHRGLYLLNICLKGDSLKVYSESLSLVLP